MARAFRRNKRSLTSQNATHGEPRVEATVQACPHAVGAALFCLAGYGRGALAFFFLLSVVA